MSRGNGYGTHSTTRAAAMAAYDRAPPEVRWLVQRAVAKWCAENVTEMYYSRALVVGPSRALQMTARTMERNEQFDTMADYGPTHPEAAHV